MLVTKLKQWLEKGSFSSMLEQYIISGYPKSIYDIERLTREFEIKLSRGDLK